MNISASDMECVLGDKVLNGIETFEHRVRKIFLEEVAKGTDLTTWFQRYDLNRDGHVTAAELMDGLLASGLNVDDFIDCNEELDAFMKKIERGVFLQDMDGKIDYQEFIKFIVSHGEFSPTGHLETGIHRPTELIYRRGVKLVGLLFGQQWNPTYRKVEEKILSFYNNLHAIGEHRFEIVYVSLDQDKQRFTDYYRDMPWLAIPFSERERRHFLARKYFVASTPRMVLLDTHGHIISYDVKNDCCDYYHKPAIALQSWLAGKVREVAHGGVSFH